MGWALRETSPAEAVRGRAPGPGDVEGARSTTGGEKVRRCRKRQPCEGTPMPAPTNLSERECGRGCQLLLLSVLPFLADLSTLMFLPAMQTFEIKTTFPSQVWPCD